MFLSDNRLFVSERFRDHFSLWFTNPFLVVRISVFQFCTIWRQTSARPPVTCIGRLRRRLGVKFRFEKKVTSKFQKSITVFRFQPFCNRHTLGRRDTRCCLFSCFHDLVVAIDPMIPVVLGIDERRAERRVVERRLEAAGQLAVDCAVWRTVEEFVVAISGAV